MFLLIVLTIATLIILFLGICLVLLSRRYSKVKRKMSSIETELTQELATEEKLQTKLTELKEEMTQNVLVDSLTGLPSRKVFEDRLQVTISQSYRYQLIFGVMFLDIDSFKVVNDALGHDAGDEVLQEVASCLHSRIRQVDSISRFSGDEFVFLLPQLAKAETAAYVAQRFIEAFSRPFHIRNEDIYLTASIGIATYPTDGQDVKTLLANAAAAMHQAKLQGRNTYQFYREEMHAMSHRELILSSNLRSETIYRNFFLYYQPRFDLETNKVICMEAQLQWEHPSYGLISFNEFARLAENCGKIVAVGEWILRNGLHHFLEWKALGFDIDRVSIPVTFKMLENSHFIYKVSSVLQEMNVDPTNLMLEITEESLIVKVDVLEKVLHMLKHLGVQIAISHFGAGYLSLQNMRRLPIDDLKIDASIVKDIIVNEESAAIVKMIITLAISLQITAVAEGVENEEQKQMLQSFGCKVIQGPLFGQPAQAHEFASMFVHSS